MSDDLLQELFFGPGPNHCAFPGLSHAPFSLHSGLRNRPFSVYFLLFLQAKPAKTAKNRPFVSAAGAKSAQTGKAPGLSLSACITKGALVYLGPEEVFKESILPVIPL